MNLFLDDTRIPPKGEEWVSAKSFEEFINLINKYKGCLETIDLDYNIGDDSLYTGYSILKYLKRNNINCKCINIHSTHEVGRELMIDYAKSNFEDIKITEEYWL